MRLAAVVFPPPDGPTSANVEDAGTLKEIPSIAGASAPAYENLTSRNSIEKSAGRCECSGTDISGAAMTSSMRESESPAVFSPFAANITRASAVEMMPENTA